MVVHAECWCATECCAGLDLALSPAPPYKIFKATLFDANGNDISSKIHTNDVLVAVNGTPIHEVLFTIPKCLRLARTKPYSV